MKIGKHECWVLLAIVAVIGVVAWTGGCAPAHHVTERQAEDIRRVADEALAAAASAEDAAGAANERMDRMFEEAQTK